MEPEELYECIARDPNDITKCASATFEDAASRARVQVLTWINEQLANGFDRANIQVFQVEKKYHLVPHDFF